MQFSNSGIFQKNEQDLFALPSREIPRSFQRKINALVHDPLTFVILVWAMMFFFASLYFVYAQEVGKPASSNHHISQKACTSTKSKTAVKKHTAPAGKIETVEVFSAGLGTVSTDVSRKVLREKKSRMNRALNRR